MESFYLLVRYVGMSSIKTIAFSIAMILASFSGLQGQTILTWDDLGDVTWSEVYDESTGVTHLTGTFGEHLKSFQGKEVIISGYVIPLDAMGLSYALSRTSFAACFFCGQAGPETVMDLNVKPKSIASYRQKNTLIKFKGTLVLKESNETGLNYTLDFAKEIE